MSENPLVSIITICFNSEKYIRHTIESVLNQSYENIEYIIVDGASTDNTLNIIKEYMPKFGGRLKLISEKDKGIYDAMNKGLRAASGEIIGIINSDDWYELNTVEIAVENYLKNSDTVYYGLLRYIAKEKELMIYCSNHEFIERAMIPHPTCFIPKAIYEKYGLYSLEYRYTSDYDFIFRLVKSGVKFKRLDNILANFREGGASGLSDAKCEEYNIRYKYGYLTKKQLSKKINIEKLKKLLKM